MSQSSRTLRRLARVLQIILVLVLLVMAGYEVYKSVQSVKKPLDTATFLGTAVGIIGLEFVLAAYLRKSRDIRAAQDLLRVAVGRSIRQRLDQLQLAEATIELPLVSNETGHSLDLSSFIDAQLERQRIRLFVTGLAGTGKSYTAVALGDRLLAASQLVPVIVPLSHWQVGDPVQKLVTTHLVNNFGVASRTANELVNSHQIIPIFDGLDEIDQAEDAVATAVAFLRALNVWDTRGVGARFVLTCQLELWNQLPDNRPELAAESWQIAKLNSTNAARFLRRLLALPRNSDLPDDLVTRVERAGLGWVLERADSLAMLGNLLERGGVDAAAAVLDTVRERGLIEEFVGSTLRIEASTLRRLRNVAAVGALHSYALYLVGNRSGVQVGNRRLEDRDIRLHRLWPIAGARAPRIVDLIMALSLSLPGLAWLGLFLWARGIVGIAAFVIFCGVWLRMLIRTTLKAWVPPAIFELPRVKTRSAFVRQTVLALLVGTVAYIFANAIFAIATFTTAWLAVGLTVGVGQTLTTDQRVRALGPNGVLEREYFISMASALVVAPVICYAFYLSPGSVWGVILGLLYSGAVGLTVASALWRRYLALCVLTVPKMGISPRSALNQAHRLGLVRVNGTDYRFRSIDVENYFARTELSLRHLWNASREGSRPMLKRLP